MWTMPTTEPVEMVDSHHPLRLTLVNLSPMRGIMDNQTHHNDEVIANPHDVSFQFDRLFSTTCVRCPIRQYLFPMGYPPRRATVHRVDAARCWRIAHQVALDPPSDPFR